jgi:hypothetical protein
MLDGMIWVSDSPAIWNEAKRMKRTSVFYALMLALLGAPAAFAQEAESPESDAAQPPEPVVVPRDAAEADDDVFIPSEEVQAAEELAFPVDI